MQANRVRIVVVGDQGVGKTSLVTALISNTFQEPVQSVIPPVLFTSESTNTGVEASVIDTSSSEADLETTKELIKQADVICVVYAVNNVDSKKNLRQRWLDMIVNELGKTAPIVIIGNKVDLRDREPLAEELEAEMQPFIDDYPLVDHVILCSAKAVLRVDEAFQLAVEAVLYPSFPLYDYKRDELKPAATLAFERIFRLYDRNHDGFWDDSEFNRFQSHCYPVEGPLDPSAIEDIKHRILDKDPNGVDPSKGISFRGFLCLQHILLRLGRLETVWASLRAFGYNRHVVLGEEFTTLPSSIMEQATKPGFAAQISPVGMSFLRSLFESFSKRNAPHSQLICPVADVEEIFSIIPDSVTLLKSRLSFPFCVPLFKRAEGELLFDENSWNALWTMLALIDPILAYTYINMLGFEPPEGLIRADALIQVAKLPAVIAASSSPDPKLKLRTSFQCYVVNHSNSICSELLCKYVGAVQAGICAMNKVQEDWLLLRAIDGDHATADSSDCLCRADAVMFVCDLSSDSSVASVIQSSQTMMKQSPGIPLCIFASASGSSTKPNLVQSMKRFARSNSIAIFSEPQLRSGQVWTSIVGLCKRRTVCTDRGIEHSSGSALKTLVSSFALAFALGLFGWVGYNVYKEGQFPQFLQSDKLRWGTEKADK